MVNLLTVDGIKYDLYTPSREDELEEFVEKNAKLIFGEKSCYFSIKQKLTNLSGIGSIPDGYVIRLEKPYGWFIVEVELSSHPIFNHIVPQLNKFVQALKQPANRRNLVETFYNQIKEDIELEAFVKKQIGSGELFRFLTNTIDKSPILSVIIDSKTEELEEACSSIPINDKRITEFKIYQRTDSEIKNAFFFEPLISEVYDKTEKTTSSSNLIGKITSQPQYTKPILEVLIEKGGQGKVHEIIKGVYNKIQNKLTEHDLALLPSGREKRWENQLRWQAFNLKKKGIIDPKSPHGSWKITEQGKQFYTSNE